MLQPSVSQEALNALAAFQAYAAGTLLVLDLIGTFVFALSGAVAGAAPQSLVSSRKSGQHTAAFAQGVIIHDRRKLLARMLLQRRADWSRRPTRASIANPAAASVVPP